MDFCSGICLCTFVHLEHWYCFEGFPVSAKVHRHVSHIAVIVWTTSLNQWVSTKSLSFYVIVAPKFQCWYNCYQTLYKIVLNSKTLIVGHVNAEKATAARKPDLYLSLLNSCLLARRWNHLQTVAASLICPTEANLHADCTGMNAHTFYFGSLLYFYFSTVFYCVIFHWYWEYFLVEFCKVYGIADTSI